ncbi:type II secretion system protein [Thermotoga sp. KOL6]|uniref:type II secretion system protein n=1 Tax=Thermotoga sp. KOL6 TaxID=126741 RepID=UPI000C789F1D|nr:type II secretion system protein [Thermotoga sp. KOL6]PLV59860.1 hypothetical protein AS005_00740 [Thermotoga sp. KOL6]
MRKGSILITTLVVLLIVAVFSTVMVIYFQQYKKNAEYTSQRLEAAYRASNALNLGISFLKVHFEGILGIDVDWKNGKVQWLEDFKKRVFSQTDGDAWKKMFELVEEDKYYDLALEEGFSEEMSKYELSKTEVIALPFQNSYYTLLVARSQVGRAVVYKYALLSSNFLNKYVYFTEKETRNGEEIHFITQDVIDGPFRSNDVIHVSGEPLFKGSVEFKDIDVEEGNGPRYENPPPKYLTQEDIEKYNMERIKNYYLTKIREIVKPASEAVVYPSDVGIELPTIRELVDEWQYFWWYYRKYFEPVYVIEFNTPRGQSDNDYLIKVKYKEIYKTYRSSDGQNWEFVSSEEGNLRELFHIKPKPNSDQYHLVVTGQKAREILGLDKGTYDIHFNGVLKTDTDVYIKNMSNSGKPMFVEGKYTIVAKNIYVMDHIIYNDFREVLETIAASQGINSSSEEKIADETVIRPLDKNGNVETEEYAELLKNHKSDDFLNLVAMENVVVKKKRKNMKIFASIYAFDGSFYVEGYDTIKPKGELTIFGSLMQNVRGPIGTFYWEKEKPQILTGYRKNYVYDWRVLKGIAAAGTPATEEESLVLLLREVY